MPIDVRLLRNAESAEWVRRWQHQRRRRRRSEHDEKITVEDAIRLDQNQCEALKKLNQYKNACRQQRKRPDPVQLESYQRESNDSSLKLRKALWSIANAIDETLIPDVEEEILVDASISRAHKEIRAKNAIEFLYQPLLEIGVLECIGTICSLKNGQSGMLCWSRLGMDWSSALSRHIWSSMSLSTQKGLTILRLSELLPLEYASLHDMVGSPLQFRRSCTICSIHPSASCECPNSVDLEEDILAPSWLSYLKLNYCGKTLGDKQLPKVTMYVSPSTLMENDNGHAKHCFVDQREQQRRASFPCPSAFSRIQYEIYQVLILTSATWADSRGAQQEWMNSLMEFYYSLVGPAVRAVNKCLLRQRLMPPCDLLPGEASRIVLEGFIEDPISNVAAGVDNKNNDDTADDTEDEQVGNWVILGYLSNFLDYPTRSCRIKNNQHQFCHMLQGVICSIPETMRWQMNVNAFGDGSVAISESLTKYFPCNYSEDTSTCESSVPLRSLVLPKTRTVITTKNGRYQIQDLLQAETPLYDIVSPTTIGKSGKLQPTNKARVSSKVKSDGNRVLQGPPTKMQIQCEALSSPFGFLPFYI